MNSYQKVQIGKFLKRIKRPVELLAEKDYMLVTVKLNHKGVVLREIKKGSLIQSKMFEVKEGDFILSGIDARNGAFGIVPKELDGAIVTNDFWYFEIDSSIIDKHFFLELTSTSWFDDICRKGSDGTTQRIRLQKDKFFNQEISLPSPREQQAFIEKFLSVKSINTTLSCEISNQLNILKKLRQSILQEAIEGKLTAIWREENPAVEPASVLLEKIKAEKEKLIREGKIKKEKPLPEIKADEIPFDIPKECMWVRLGEIFIIHKGMIGIQSAVPGDYPLVVTAEERLSHNVFQIDGEAIIIPMVSSTGHGHASLKRIHYQYGKFAVGSILSALTPVCDNLINTYFYYIFLSAYKDELIVSKMSGAANVSLTLKGLSEILVPIVPIHTQNNTKKLFAYCGKLEEQIKASKSNTEALTQAFLKEAFGAKGREC